MRKRLTVMGLLLGLAAAVASAPASQGHATPADLVFREPPAAAAPGEAMTFDVRVVWTDHSGRERGAPVDGAILTVVLDADDIVTPPGAITGDDGTARIRLAAPTAEGPHTIDVLARDSEGRDLAGNVTGFEVGESPYVFTFVFDRGAPYPNTWFLDERIWGTLVVEGPEAAGAEIALLMDGLSRFGDRTEAARVTLDGDGRAAIDLAAPREADRHHIVAEMKRAGRTFVSETFTIIAAGVPPPGLVAPSETPWPAAAFVAAAGAALLRRRTP